MRVIKLGGRAQNDATLAAEIHAAWKSADGRVCVVHGGGDEITALQVALGRTPEFVNGRRVTTGDDIQLLRMVLSGVINKRLVSTFTRAGIPAVGISGEDGTLIAARRGEQGSEMFDLGAVGVPEAVNTSLLEMFFSGGYMPVVSPVGSDGGATAAGALNVNGDDAAAAIASAIGADELLFVADVAGVLKDESVISRVDLESVPAMIVEGTIRGGMTAKLDAAKAALAGGVGQVRISDISGITDKNRGTKVTTNRRKE